MGNRNHRIMDRDPLSGEKVDRRIGRSDRHWQALEEEYSLAAETENPGAWLEDRIAEADLLEEYLRMSADQLMKEADRVQRDYLNPGHSGRISDAGRSRKGVQIMAQAGHAVEDFLWEVHRHPSFRELVADIEPLEKESFVSPTERFSRVATNLQLVKQAGKLREKKAEIRILRRRMRLHSMAILGAIRTDELARQMEGLVTKAEDFTRPYRQGEGRVNRAKNSRRRGMTDREKRMLARMFPSRYTLVAKRKMDRSRRERREVEELYEG